MADKKISALTAATTPLAGTEVLPIVQSGSTVKVSVANLTVGRAVATAGGSFTDNITQGTAAKGVNFTANTPAAGMTSQLLNWYEEGTWTPTYIPSAGAFASITYDTVTGGKYTRIGNTVYVQAFVRTSAISIGTASGVVSIGGLPFTSSANSSGKLDAYFSLTINYSTGFVSINPTSALGGNSSTTAELLYRATSSGSSSNLAVTELATGASSNTILISGSYICA